MTLLIVIVIVVALTAWLLWAVDAFGRDAVRLNLQVESGMAKIGDTVPAVIAPTNAAGAPAQVFNPEYLASGGYDVTVAPDGLSAVLTAASAGTGFTLSCAATTKHGLVLSETKPLPDVEIAVDDEAVALNLTVG